MYYDSNAIVINVLFLLCVLLVTESLCQDLLLNFTGAVTTMVTLWHACGIWWHACGMLVASPCGTWLSNEWDKYCETDIVSLRPYIVCRVGRTL